MAHIRLQQIAVVIAPVIGGIICGFFLAAVLAQRPQTTTKASPEMPAFVSTHVDSEPAINTKFRLCVEGDNNLATLDDIIGRDEDVYAYVAPKLATCDLIMANLETNISTPGVGVLQPKGYNYNAPLAAVAALRKGRVSIVTLANNHSMDFGPTGLVDEMQHLTAGGIAYFGGGVNLTAAFTPTYYQSHGTTIAFIGANDIENWITDAKPDTAGSAYFDEGLLTSEIAEAHKQADVVLIYLHWGEENSDVVNDRQIYFAHKFIDAGADIVVGTGPHVRQASDFYQNKPIFYSIGNFAVRGFFEWPDRSTGDILNIDFDGRHIVNTSTTAVTIDYAGLPDGPYH